MNAGIVIRKEDAVARSKAAKLKLDVRVSHDDWAIPWEHTLFIAKDTCVPWDLVSAGFCFLERWDCAAPLWRYGATAGTVGTPAEQKRTQEICRDVRLLLYTPELLFVRNSEVGRALIETWLEECKHGNEKLLAFLRALYRVKPRFCALPRSWLANLEQRARSDMIAMQSIRRHNHEPIVQVEISPGHFVRCRESEKDKILEQYRQLKARQNRIAHGR